MDHSLWSRKQRIGAVSVVMVACLQASVLWGAQAPDLDLDPSSIDRNGRMAASLSPIVQKAAPSVVNIYSSRVVRIPEHDFFDHPFFRRFFDREDPGLRRGPSTRKATSLGSGVIVTKDGYLLTNNHVVENADEIRVVLADGNKEYEAEVVGTDPQTDIAVLKIGAENLPAIVCTDSDQLEVGDIVLAIGNPFSVGQTVTSGIVSGVGRGSLGIVDYENFIQTDADINPGNSGGALVDVKGRLVGINTVIFSRTGGSQGIGFAIPANLARTVLERIVTDGKVTRGYLGVLIQPLTPDLAEAFDIEETQGALVGEVQPDTPAEDAGLKAGDVIVELNGRKVEDSRKFRLKIAQTSPGTKVTLKLLRDGKTKTVSVKLGELPAELAGAGGTYRDAVPERDSLEGVEVRDLDAQTRRQFSIPSRVKGALVVNVDPDSNAYYAGLREGDVIMEIDREQVEDASDAVKLSQAAEDDKILLRVWSRKGGFGVTSYMTVENMKDE